MFTTLDPQDGRVLPVAGLAAWRATASGKADNHSRLVRLGSVRGAHIHHTVAGLLRLWEKI